MKLGAPGSFGAHLRALRENAGFTQEELATIAGISVHAVSALERGERRRPHVETVRALSAALDLTNASRDAFLESARAPARTTAADELMGRHCRCRSPGWSAATRRCRRSSAGSLIRRTPDHAGRTWRCREDTIWRWN